MADEVTITECAVLFRITNRKAYRDSRLYTDDACRYEWTRGVWDTNYCKCLSSIRYAFCVDRDFIVLEVYQVDGWDEPKPNRYLCRELDESQWTQDYKEFRGSPDAIGNKYKGKSVEGHYRQFRSKPAMLCLCQNC